jgi:hypothetical protein
MNSWAGPMATTDDVARLDAIIRPLAGMVYEAAANGSGGTEGWSSVVLDVRYSTQVDSFIDKTRLELTDGRVVSLSLPVAATHHMIALGNARSTGKDRWYGFLLRITAAGICKGEFNYDPNCADDPSFYES